VVLINEFDELVGGSVEQHPEFLTELRRLVTGTHRLGSGAAVVAARETVEATQEHWRKLIGIEMEAYGVHHASQIAVHPAPLFLCMKSISDFAGPDKNDAFQDYAAFIAAQLCHLFLTEEWDNLFPR
jgi:nucleoside phosphorylase